MRPPKTRTSGIDDNIPRAKVAVEAKTIDDDKKGLKCREKKYNVLYLRAKWDFP